MMVMLLAGGSGGGGVVTVVGRLVPVMVAIGLLLLDRVMAPFARRRGKVGRLGVAGRGGGGVLLLPAVRLLLLGGGPGVRFVCCEQRRKLVMKSNNKYGNDKYEETNNTWAIWRRSANRFPN